MQKQVLNHLYYKTNTESVAKTLKASTFAITILEKLTIGSYTKNHSHNVSYTDGMEFKWRGICIHNWLKFLPFFMIG